MTPQNTNACQNSVSYDMNYPANWCNIMDIDVFGVFMWHLEIIKSNIIPGIKGESFHIDKLQFIAKTL